MSAMTFVKELQTMQPSTVIRDERVRNQFINVYNSIWQDGGESVYEREAIYFNRELRDKESLRKCSGTSVFYAFIDLAVRGLTLEPGTQALCYLLPRNVKTGVDAQGKDIWEKVCNLTISGYGELVMRAKAGQIRYADNPVIVYEGDVFEYGEKDGHKLVNYVSAIPRKSNRIIACFIKITRADGSIDYSVMTENDWMRLKGYSDKQNSYTDKRTGETIVKGNQLYTGANGQIDTGFLMAKCVKHAFKTYPKLKIGKGTSLESEIIEQNVNDDFDPYDLDREGSDSRTEESADESFAPTPDYSEGVTIDDNDDTF